MIAPLCPVFILLPFSRSLLCFRLSSVQSYIQSFRERQVQAGPPPRRPHTVVDVGYDRGSITPLTAAVGASLRV